MGVALFFAETFLAGAFLAATFLAATFLAGAFLVIDFLAAAFFVAGDFALVGEVLTFFESAFFGMCYLKIFLGRLKLSERTILS